MTRSQRFGAGGLASLMVVVLASASCGSSSAGPDGSPTGSAGTGAGSAGTGAGNAGTGAAGTGTGAAGTSGGGTPVAQCKELVSTLCSRDNTCNMLNGTAADQTACVNANIVAFGCDRAAMSFSACLADAKALSCASLFPAGGAALPGACDDPVNSIPLSTAQQKCGDLAGVVCERSAGCMGITPTPAQLANCQIAVFADLGCLYAIEVSATFDQCLKDLPAAPCPNPDGGASQTDGGIPSCTDPITFVD